MKDLASISLKVLSRFERFITTLAFAVMILVIFGDVAIRELTGTGFHWTRQVGVYANVVLVMLGMGLASASGTHLRPRFADQWLPAHWDSFLERLGNALMSVFCVAACVVAGQVVGESIALDEKSMLLRWSIWPVQAFIPLAFALAAFRHALFGIYPSLAPAAEDGGRDRN